MSIFVADCGHSKLRLLSILHHNVLVESDLMSGQNLFLTACLLGLMRRVPTTMVRCVPLDVTDDLMARVPLVRAASDTRSAIR